MVCHLIYLKDHPDDAVIWGGLGTLYLNENQKHLATTCFKQAAKTMGHISSHVPVWFFLGPFVIGKSEVDGDPVAFYGGIHNVSNTRYKKGKKFISELLPNAIISWKSINQLHPNKNVRISTDVNWSDLVQSLGSMGITEFQGWLVGEFIVTQDHLEVTIQCLGVHTIYVDHTILNGEIYWREQFAAYVTLDSGVHTLYIRTRSKSSIDFRCSISETVGSFSVLSPFYLPDLIDGYLFSYYIGLPIVNKLGSKWLTNVRVKMADIETDHGPIVKLEQLQSVSIAPGQVCSLPLRLIATSETKLIESCDSDFKLLLKIFSSESVQSTSINLRCRKRDQSFLFTFLDHDGSVQHGAVIAPRGECDLNTCPIVLTLHGTTVPPQNQADSYKYMENGIFIFGFEKAWVLAPTRFVVIFFICTVKIV